MKKLWSASAPLTATGIVMTIALIGSLAGLFLDSRVITGMPAWMKPAKFAMSTGLFSFTLAWIFTYVRGWRKLGWVVSVVLVLEVGIIDWQAARGTTSHFNVGQPLDRTLFAVMGAAILILYLASIVLTVVLLRTRFEDPALGWSIRLGMAIMVMGAGIGGIMTTPTSAQLAEARITHELKVAGAHTVGAPDGGPGLPGVGWSRQHGDLRAPHFLGLHAMQLVPLLGWFARRKLVMVWAMAGSYFGLFAILTWQALRGQSIVQPDAWTVGALGVWALASAAILYYSDHYSDYAEERASGDHRVSGVQRG